MKLPVDMNLSPRWIGVLADVSIEAGALVNAWREQRARLGNHGLRQFP